MLAWIPSLFIASLRLLHVHILAEVRWGRGQRLNMPIIPLSFTTWTKIYCSASFRGRPDIEPPGQSRPAPR